jgi:cysteine desulfurase/selenocysteine lyase
MLYLPAEFPLDPSLCYLNHAAIGPWPKRTAQVVAAFAQKNMLRGGTDYPEWLAVETRLRERIARWIGAASPEDIALTKNTSEGLSTIAAGLDWQSGDEIVGVAHDFISNRMVWEALADRGVAFRTVDVLSADDPEGALIDAMSDQTRLVAVSTVNYAIGLRLDLERVSAACREHGALLSVDAIQSLGALPFDLQKLDADFVTCGGHKWLLAPEGLGFFYCRPTLRETLSLRQYGWAMRESPYDFDAENWQPARSARRFESGTPNMMAIQALDASLSLFEEIGSAEVQRRLEENVGWLDAALAAIPGIEILTPREAHRRAGILTFRSATMPGAELHRALMARSVICSARAGGVRFAPHFYTSKDALERAVGCVAELTDQQASM